MTARRVGAPNASHAEPVVSAGQKPLADVADAIQAEHAVGGRVPLIVAGAEVLEVPLEDGV